MVEVTKEQVWKEEARKAYQDQQSQDNEGGCREPIGFVQGYLAAKKSDFEEIKTLKEQLARAEQRIFHAPHCITNYERNECDCGYERYFSEKQNHNKENKE